MASVLVTTAFLLYNLKQHRIGRPAAKESEGGVYSLTQSGRSKSVAAQPFAEAATGIGVTFHVVVQEEVEK